MDDLDLMEQVHRRLTSYAQAGAAAAGAGDAAAVRGRGARLRVRRRLAQGSAVLVLVAAVAGGATLAGSWSGRDAVAPAGNGQAPPAATAGTGAAVAGVVRTMRAPDPEVVRKPDSIELLGRTGQGRTWSFLLTRRPDGICQLTDEDRDGPSRSIGPGPMGECGAPGGAGGGTIEPGPIQASDLNMASDGCSGGISDTAAARSGTGERGDGQYDALLTGLASPGAARIRLVLLDGRAIDVQPVATDLFEARPFATYLNECIGGVTTVAYRADGSVLSTKSAPHGPPEVGEWRATLTFGKDVAPGRRTDLLVALERGGAELYEAKDGRYKLYVVIGQHWQAIKDRLEAARRAHLIEFTARKAPDAPG
jgi:hypothetical protein